MKAPLSQIPGNHAYNIREQYNDLMSITDHSQLQQTALSLIHSGSISPTNSKKFTNTVKRSNNLRALQAYLTNFVLAADGHAVIK